MKPKKKVCDYIKDLYERVEDLESDVYDDDDDSDDDDYY